MSRRDVANGVGSNITGSPDQRFEGMLVVTDKGLRKTGGYYACFQNVLSHYVLSSSTTSSDSDRIT